MVKTTFAQSSVESGYAKQIGGVKCVSYRRTTGGKGESLQMTIPGLNSRFGETLLMTVENWRTLLKFTSQLTQLVQGFDASATARQARAKELEAFHDAKVKLDAAKDVVGDEVYNAKIAELTAKYKVNAEISE